MPDPCLHNFHRCPPRRARPFLRHHHGTNGFRDGVQHLHCSTTSVSFEDLWEGNWAEGKGDELVLNYCLFGHGGFRDGVGFLAEGC